MIDPSKPVRVFKNPKRGCYNIMQNGQLKASAKQVMLQDAEFLVRESGRQRMLRLQKRTIHAYVVGALVDYVHPADNDDMRQMAGRTARYNPHQFDSFVDKETETPLKNANLVQFDERGMTYDEAA